MDVHSAEVSQENLQVPTDTISEPTFLLTELRYTLGQLHVQLGDLDEEARDTLACEGRTVNQVLGEMLDQERKYQAKYRQLLNTALVEGDHEAGFVGQNEFERRREETIAMIAQAGDNWPEEMIETVRQQVQGDRAYTTELAECRKAMFAQEQRPDLRVPLTDPDEQNSAGAVT